MTVPAQVRNSAQKAADLQKAFSEETNPTDPANPANDQPGNGGNEPPPAPTPPPEEDWKSWKHKYDTLRGMYNSQVPKLQAEASKVPALEARVSELTEALNRRPAAAAGSSSITEKDREDFGEDTIDMMQRAARASVEAELNSLRDTIASLQTQVLPKVNAMETRQALTAEEMYFNRLAARVPDWEQINADARFHAWLLEIDPLTLTTKQAYLEQAHNDMNVEKVANFFLTWKNGLSAPAAQTTSIVPPKTDELSKQIAPGAGRNGSPPADPVTYTTSFIAKFYDDVRKGLYRGREGERAQLEQAIFSAQREGRITN